MTDNTQSEALAALIERFRGLHIDHKPDGWPAVRTREITALLDRIAELEAQLEAIGAGGVSALMGAAKAGSEPVAWAIFAEGGNIRLWSKKPLLHPSAQPLYTRPSPTEGMAGWTKLPGTLPKPGTPVLLDIGKKYPIRAMWAAKHTVQAADDDTDWGEYDEATDEYWCPEGWYEWNQNEDNHWRVTETPRAWMPLPSSPSMDGESNG